MISEIEAAKTDRDTLGGIVEVVAYGVPPGIGSHAEAHLRLGRRLGAVVLGVQAIKGVQVGSGFEVASQRGSSAHDEIVAADDSGDHGMGVTRHTNFAGGIEGGMSNGAPIVLRAAMKPLPTLMRPLASVDLVSGEAAAAHAERSDVCAVPAAAVVIESVIAIELAAAVRDDFGMQSMDDVIGAFTNYCTRVRFPCAPS